MMNRRYLCLSLFAYLSLTLSQVSAQNLRVDIQEIETAPTRVSRGQQGIVVIMEVENRSVFTVDNISASLTFRDTKKAEEDDDENAVSDLTDEYTQQRVDTITEIPARSKATLVFSVGVKLKATLGKVFIDGEFSGTALGVAVADDGATKIDEWTVEAAAALQAKQVTGDANVVSVGQTELSFTAIVANSAGAQGATALLDDVQLKFFLGGVADRSGDFVVTADGGNPQTLKSGEEKEFHFTVDVGETAQPGAYVVDVHVFGRDANSDSAISDLGADQPAELQVQSRAVLKVEFTELTPLHSVNDTIQVQASVQNLGEAGVDDSGRLTLHFPQEAGYVLLNGTPKEQPFEPDSAITWQVIAPSVASDSDTFIVEISGIPLELNTDQPAQIAAGSDTAVVQIFEEGMGGDGFIVIDSVRVIEPAGAKDGILSTDQNLTVTAFMRRSIAREVRAQIILPASYDFAGSDDFIKSVPDDTSTFVEISWNLNAPRNAQPAHFISVDAFGLDAETDRFIDAVADTVRANEDAPPMSIAVVEKASLLLRAEISEPPSARDSVLTVEQRFTITARVENRGTAAIRGMGTIALELPAGFTSGDPLIKTFDADLQNEVSWQLQAPDTPVSIAVIMLRMTDIPQDVNTDAPAAIIEDEAVFPISVNDSICLIATGDDDNQSSSVVRGEGSVNLFSLEFENNADVTIDIQHITLNIKSRQGEDISPNSVLTDLKIADHENPAMVFAHLTQLPASNPLQMEFSPPAQVLPFQSLTLDFRADIASQTSENSLRLVIENPHQNISAVDEEFNRVSIARDGFCQSFTGALNGGIININDAGLAANFYNFPNPFGSGTQPETRFHYRLEQDSDISLRIYTLFGELVWSRQFRANDPEGKGGIHDGFGPSAITWNGRNDKQKEVVNGVYIAVLETNGEKAVTKIAVAK